MVEVENKRFAVNMYDVFANFLPGFVLIGGVLLPFVDEEWITNIGFSEGTFVALAAFAIGGGVQAIGTRTKHYRFRLPYMSFPQDSKPVDGKSPPWIVKKSRLIDTRKMPFDDKMEKITEGDGDLTFPENKFIEACKQLFGIENEAEHLDDWRYLFKMVISYLEVSPHNRTLRIQAQHLAARGLYVTFFALFLYYSVLFLYYIRRGKVYIERLPIMEIRTVMNMRYVQIDHMYIHAVSDPILLATSVFCLFLSHIFYQRSVHFEDDVVKYMVSEMVLSSEVTKETG